MYKAKNRETGTIYSIFKAELGFGELRFATLIDDTTQEKFDVDDTSKYELLLVRTDHDTNTLK